MVFSSLYHVGSGSFEASASQPRILQAFLGTCVGIAIFDDTADVGGLIHLLLPEPINPESVDLPEKYATTAMPLFLNRLKELGATSKNMKAVVAGGALVGPLTYLDINLDIGGRTAEKAKNELDKEGIPIVQWETGGFFTCSIDLNMQNWQWRIQPSGFDATLSDTITSKPTESDVQQAIEAIRPIPQVALKVLRIIQEATYDIEKIAHEVKKDQVISARTIQLCNSALFSKRQEVVTLDHALVFLGQELFVKLIISAAVQSYYDQCGNGYSLCKGGLYHHAIGTAMTTEKIAEMTGDIHPGVAYMAGLLHDIGKVVLDQYISGAYPMFYREFQDRPSEIIDVESGILGMDHTRVGELLAKKWSLPDNLTNAIRFHHFPEKSPDDQRLTTIVYLADLLMSRFNTGLEMERMGTNRLKENLSQLGLTPESFTELVDLMPDKVFEPAENQTGNGD